MKDDIVVYSSKELAQLLRTNEHTINRLRRTQLLSGIKLGKGWIFPQEEVTKFLKKYRGLDLNYEMEVAECVRG